MGLLYRQDVIPLESAPVASVPALLAEMGLDFHHHALSGNRVAAIWLNADGTTVNRKMARIAQSLTIIRASRLSMIPRFLTLLCLLVKFV